MRTVAFMNQKGGVGKTSCTHHLAGALAHLGRRVLLIDADPQASLSQGFWGPEVVEGLDPGSSIAPILAGHRPFPSQVVRPTGLPGIDLVPGSIAATVWNVPAPEQTPDDQKTSLKVFVDEVLAEGSHDIILIDCPPNLHLCSYAALVAADYLVVPMQPEDYGAQGINAVRGSVELVQGGPNPGLQLLGYLLTMTAREKIQDAFAATLRQVYGDQVFASVVPRLPVLKEAIANRKPVSSYKPKSVAAQRINEVATELLGRMSRLDRVDLGVLAEVV